MFKNIAFSGKYGDSNAVRYEFVSVLLGDQNFALPIESVRDIVLPGSISKVPLVPKAIVGSLNLRGYIIIVIDLASALGIAKRPQKIGNDVAEEKPKICVNMVCNDGSTYGFLVDKINGIVEFSKLDLENVPGNFDSVLRQASGGIVKQSNGVLITLDVNKIIDSIHD